MRVSDNMAAQLLLENIQRIRQEIFVRNRELASGKKLHRPSQDPSGAARVTRIREELSRLVQFGRNADRSQVLLNAAHGALNSVRNALDAAVERAAFALNDVNRDQRDIIAGEIEEIRDFVLALSETQVDGRYVFSADRTDTPPFRRVGNTFVYQGGDTSLSVEIADGRRIRTGITGDRAFVDPSGDILNSLTELAESLRVSDVDAARSAVDALGQAGTVIDVARVQISESLRLIDTTRLEHDRIRLALTEENVALEDADLTESITALSSAEQRLQAALQTGVRRIPSLFDLIG